MNTNNYIPSNRFRKILASARKMMHGSRRSEAYKELYEKTGSVYRWFKWQAEMQQKEWLAGKTVGRNEYVAIIKKVINSWRDMSENPFINRKIISKTNINRKINNRKVNGFLNVEFAEKNNKTNRYKKIIAVLRRMMHGSNQPKVYKKLYIKTGYLYADFICCAVEQRQKGLNNKIARRNRSVGKNKFATQMNRMINNGSYMSENPFINRKLAKESDVNGNININYNLHFD